eukprot:6525860-Prymnesium_polylepis.1
MPGSQPYTWGRRGQMEDEELRAERVHVRSDGYWSGSHCWPPREIEELYRGVARRAPGFTSVRP